MLSTDWDDRPVVSNPPDVPCESCEEEPAENEDTEVE